MRTTLKNTAGGLFAEIAFALLLTAAGYLISLIFVR